MLGTIMFRQFEFMRSAGPAEGLAGVILLAGVIFIAVVIVHAVLIY